MRVKALTSTMQTAVNSHPRSRLITLIVDRNVWKMGGNSIDVIDAYCVMICRNKNKERQTGKNEYHSGSCSKHALPVFPQSNAYA